MERSVSIHYRVSGRFANVTVGSSIEFKRNYRVVAVCDTTLIKQFHFDDMKVYIIFVWACSHSNSLNALTEDDFMSSIQQTSIDIHDLFSYQTSFENILSWNAVIKR